MASFEKALRALRASSPERELTVAGASWRYLSWGEGDETLLVLPGHSGGPELASLLVSALPPGFRLLSPAHPDVPTMAALTSGLAAMLDREGVARAHVLGKSYGGMVAQCLVRSRPDRVASLSLFLTAAPDPARVNGHRRVRCALRVLPPAVVRLATRLLLGRLVASITEEREFWREYLLGQVDQYDRREALALQDRVIDFDANHRFAPEDLAGWAGPVLLMDSDDDPVIDPAARALLRRTYPQARTHEFRGTRHSASVLRPDEFAAVLGDFLRGASG